MGRKGVSKYTGQFIAGHKFGEWVVVDGKIHGSPAQIDVRCMCDAIHRIDVYTLVKGKSTSCGCTPRTADSAPNWKGINGVSSRLLRNAKSLNVSREDLANSFSTTCYLTGQTLTDATAVPYTMSIGQYIEGPNGVLNTSSGSTTSVTWVHNSVSPMIQQYGIVGAIQIAKTIVQTTNIFDQMGMKPTEKP